MTTRTQIGLNSTAQKRVAMLALEVAMVAMQSAATIASQSPLASSLRSWEPRWREPSALSTRPDRADLAGSPGAGAGVEARLAPPVSFAFGLIRRPLSAAGQAG